MSFNRREFLQILAAASACGLPLDSQQALAAGPASNFYDMPKFGNVTLMHITDCHAQLLPIYYREPNVNIGVGRNSGKAPHLVGEALLKAFGIKPGTPEAWIFETGTNQWNTFAQWPPKTTEQTLWFGPGSLSVTKGAPGADAYTSDPRTLPCSRSAGMRT